VAQDKTSHLTPHATAHSRDYFAAMYQYISVPLYFGLATSQLNMGNLVQRDMRSNSGGIEPGLSYWQHERLHGYTNHQQFQRQGQNVPCGTGRLIYHSSYIACGVQKKRRGYAPSPPLASNTNKQTCIRDDHARHSGRALTSYPQLTYPHSRWVPSNAAVLRFLFLSNPPSQLRHGAVVRPRR
jgi:hypothetical protein